MSCIGWDRGLDPELHDHYSERLLEPGWAGVLTLEEAEYIREKLEANPKLRKKWKIRGKGRIPLTVIAERAYPEDPAQARQHIKKEMSRAARRKHTGKAKMYAVV